MIENRERVRATNSRAARKMFWLVLRATRIKMLNCLSLDLTMNQVLTYTFARLRGSLLRFPPIVV